MPVSEIIRKLRGAGHKVTPQRITIIQHFLESSELLTPAALYDRVHKLDPRIGEVTVYRTLNILAEMGLICMIHTGDNAHSYISRPPEHHGHLICSDCSRVIDFTDCEVAVLEKKLSDETGFKIEDSRLDFYGHCRDCTLRTIK
ncbi:MAG TPA: Fur family transcriptional regulator [Dehalococcoidales bacterium]|nr:Fur family transcriptional regulator [Dehalococcoidales bacterium]